MRRGRNRKGFTLILMTFMLLVLIGLAAFVADFGRMFLFRNQLHAASDAASLAAAFRIMKQDAASSTDSAISYATRHSVSNTPVSLVAGDVVPGTWTRAGGFVPTADWTDPTIDAVRTTTRYFAPYGFGRIFGLTSVHLTATSEAAVGYVGATTCIRPVAMPYQALLNQLFGPGVQNPTYDLTSDDVINLRAATIANEVQLKVSNAGSSSGPGSFYLVQMGPYMYADGTVANPGPTWGGQGTFLSRFGGDCSNSPWSIGTNDWLEGEQGNASGPMESAFEQFCGIGNMNGNGSWTCGDPMLPEDQRKIKVAMWAQEGNPGGCTPRCYQVKYAGMFVITRYTKSTGSTPDGLWGYFTSMPSTGTFTANPSPLQMIALVK